jgi:hypothetical protein
MIVDLSRETLKAMSEIMQKQMRSFGSWSLTFGLGYFLLAHLSEPWATKADMAFIAIGVLALAVAGCCRWWERRKHAANGPGVSRSTR